MKKKPWDTFGTCYCYKFKIVGNHRILKKENEKGVEQILPICLINSWNLGSEINIYQKAWNGNLIIWDLSSLKLWHVETKKPRNFETKKPRIFETKKLRNQETKQLWNQETKSQATKKPRNFSSKGIPHTWDVQSARTPIIGKIIKAFVGHVCVIFIENILQSHFQNGDGNIMLHRALVKSKFDGLKSRKLRFGCFPDSWNS